MFDSFNEKNFWLVHSRFKGHMLESSGEPFQNFKHPFLVKDEISYKWKVYNKGINALFLENWSPEKIGKGSILESVRKACMPEVSANLLVHQYGNAKGNSASPLYRVNSKSEIKSLEEQLYNFYLGGPFTLKNFGERFDEFAVYLRKNSLGCKWSFVAYLAFLLRPQTFFPVLPGAFQNLINFYGIDAKFEGKVEWSRYLMLLNLADCIKEKLLIYGTADAVEIQSYIFVASWLIRDIDESDTNTELEIDIDIGKECAKRVAQAHNRERIGLLGEEFIYKQEIKKLEKLGLRDLTSKVKMKSIENTSCGFDILSFDEYGDEIHIEVKSTTMNEYNDPGFWISNLEKRVAEKDEKWTLYRVWCIDSNPHSKDLGNLFRSQNENWKIDCASWFVSQRT